MTGLRFTVVPANEASWEDLQAVFGTRGDPPRCWCQRFRMSPGESWASVGAEELAARFRQQTACGHPESATTSGLVACLDGEPVGWCAVEPRAHYARLLRNNRVPWQGRTEDKTDDRVWAVTASSPEPATAAAASAVRWCAPRWISRATAAPARSRATRC